MENVKKEFEENFTYEGMTFTEDITVEILWGWIEKKLRETEKEILNEVGSFLGIGENSRLIHVIENNINNMELKCEQLGNIESIHNEDDDNELLSWVKSPDDYIRDYKEILKNIESKARREAIEECTNIVIKELEIQQDFQNKWATVSIENIISKLKGLSNELV